MRVPHGGDAIAPPDPSIAGWVFIGWSRPYSKVTEDITVRAAYREVVVEPSPPPVVPTPPPVVPTPSPNPPIVIVQPPAPPAAPTVIVQPPAPPAAQVIILRPPAPAPAPPPAEPPQDEAPPDEAPPEEPPEIVVITPDPVPAAPEPSEPAIPEMILEDPEVPLARPGFMFFAPMGADYWALLNLILTVLGAFIVPIALIKVLQRKKYMEKETEIKLNSLNKLNELSSSDKLGQDEAYIIDEGKLYQRYRLEWFAATAVLGGIGVLIFILTQDMTKIMALMDWWSFFHIAVFILEAIAFKLIYKKEKDEGDEDNRKVKIHQT
jgi:hypothetical protein